MYHYSMPRLFLFVYSCFKHDILFRGNHSYWTDGGVDESWDWMTLTTLSGVSVALDQSSLGAGAEQTGPVHCVVEAELAVVGHVDVTGADLFQRLELQRRDPALLQDQERNTTEKTKTQTANSASLFSTLMQDIIEDVSDKWQQLYRNYFKCHIRREWKFFHLDLIWNKGILRSS